jgi:ketosteroid isomerase-like protein
MYRTLFLAVGLILVAPVHADLVKDVRCREIAFSQSAENRDLNAFRSFLDADARFVAADVNRGVTEIAEAWSVFFDSQGPAIKWRPQFVEVLENGTLALSRGTYRTTGKDTDGNTVEYWGTFNSVWRLNDDGQWRVVFDAGSPAATPPDEATRALLDADNDCP